LFRLQQLDSIFQTVIKGVDADGNLITEDEQIRKFKFGEISWLGPA
jgi:biotin-(acetyl-CoA carboxylase) ligase